MVVTQIDKHTAKKPEILLFPRTAKPRQTGRHANPHKNPTMDRLFDDWLANERPLIKKTTYSTYTSIIDKHLRPFWGEKSVTELTDNDVSDYLTVICSESSNLSRSTVRGIASILKSVVTFGKDYGCSVRPETCRFSLKTRRTGINVLTDDEISMLCAALGEYPKDKDLGVLLSLKTGLRVGEVCALKWGDISLSEGFLCVNRTIQRIRQTEEGGEKTVLYFGEPKSLNSRRKIPLSPAMTDLLSLRQMPDECYVVSGRRDKTVEPRSMQRHFKTILKHAGIRDLNFHVLRHTFATKCIERGFDVKSLSMILGHSDVNTTMNVYVHPSFEKMQDMMALMD